MGEGEEVGYVPDSDEENHEGISLRSTKVSSIARKTTDAEQASSFHCGDSTKHHEKAGLEPNHVTGDPLRCSQNSYSDKSLSRVNRSRIRKLYNEVTSGAREEALYEADRYIGSQEPGELSQAIAMNVVDKLLCDNDVGSCQDIDPGKTVGSNSPPVLSVKGAQRLAKWADHRNSVRELRTFDWVENLADDDRGSTLGERTRFFSGSRGSADKVHGEDLKPAYIGSKFETGSADVSRKKSENVSYPNVTRLNFPETPNSGLVPHNLSTDELPICETERNDILKAADAQLMAEPAEQQVEDADVGVPEEMYDIGPNTQIAAEAMEALFHAFPLNNGQGEVANPETVDSMEDSNMGMPLNRSAVNHVPLKKRVPSTYDLDLVGKTIFYKRKLASNPSSSRSRSSRMKNKVEQVNEKTEVKRAKLEHETNLHGGGAANANELTRCPNQDKECDPVDFRFVKEVDKSRISSTTLISSAKRVVLGDLPFTAIPVAPRTRGSKSVKISNWTKTFSGYGKAFSVLMEASNPKDKMEDDKCVVNKSISRSSKCIGVNKGHNQVIKLDKEIGSYMEEEDTENQRKPNLKTSVFKKGAYSHPRRRRVHQITSAESTNCAKPQNLSESVNVHPANNLQSSTGRGESKVNFNSFHKILGTVKRKKRSVSTRKVSSVSGVRIMSSVKSPSVKPNSEKDFKECEPSISEVGFVLPTHSSSVIRHIPPTIEVPLLEMEAVSVSNAQDNKVNAKPDMVSPITKAQDTPKISRSQRVQKLSFARELRRLETTELAAAWLLKDSRRRKDMSKVRVLFSNNLDEDVIKQQKKILARFGIPIASSVTDATHFVADRFARTKNMLEAMAMGKPVVTHMWLDSCARTSYCIDEKNYLLRDLKKEKVIGFSLPVSLARARQQPLLKGRRVFITPNVKPDSEVVRNLVKAAHGQIHPVETICKPAMENDKIPDDLLVISCEEDYAACTSLLAKGVKVFSSDLLLNGIIVQKLEFDRYRLFVNRVKEDH